MSLKPKAKELLLKVREAILAEPARMRMSSWKIPPYMQEDIVSLGLHAMVPPCGTVACIAGWAVELGRKNPNRIRLGIEESASNLLGWRMGDGDCPLYFYDMWPRGLKWRLLDSKSGTPEYANVVAAAIDRWIEVEGNPEEFQAS